MGKVSTDRIKLNPALGRMPTLQFCRPGELRIDPSYQRDVNNGASQSLIRKIAQHWNWDLCQPLVVARRTDFVDRLFVIDGQHRLEAARVRGDIDQLPCVIVNYASAADEAASFVHLNQQRRPLNGLQLFRAAVTSGDRAANAIVAAIEAAGLSIAPHTNHASWKPGVVGNVGGLRASWSRHGPKVTAEALQVVSCAFAGETLTYLGTLFPGIAAVCAAELVGREEFEPTRFALFTAMLGKVGQQEWRKAVLGVKAEHNGMSFAQASVHAVQDAWAARMGETAAPEEPFTHPITIVPASPKCSPSVAAPQPGADGKIWCSQCDYRVTVAEASACKSRFCALRQVA